MAAKKAKAKAVRRAKRRLPAAVRRALEGRGLLARYEERPPYQREGFLRWIAQAVREETKAKRLAQMLDELERGGVYMKMKWKAPARK
ncbi:MAG TPA: YdeI/OmpD-associated family protein [Polyangiaceae bacterium]|nr:YdeI/OmpD-associated family protein [Polyangiaceae bacterium]